MKTTSIAVFSIVLLMLLYFSRKGAASNIQTSQTYNAPDISIPRMESTPLVIPAPNNYNYPFNNTGGWNPFVAPDAVTSFDGVAGKSCSCGCDPTGANGVYGGVQNESRLSAQYTKVFDKMAENLAQYGY